MPGHDGGIWICARGSHHRPVWRDAVIVVDVAPLRRIPFPFLASGITRRVLELLVGEVDLVAAELLIIGQPLPRDRIMVLAHSKEAADTHDGVGRLAADLVDHHALDLADLLAVGAIDVGAFDAVAADQVVPAVGERGRCTAGVHGHAHGVSPPWVSIEEKTCGMAKPFRMPVSSPGITICARIIWAMDARKSREGAPDAAGPGRRDCDYIPE